MFDLSFLFTLLATWFQSLFGSAGFGLLSRLFMLSCVTLMCTGCPSLEGTTVANPTTVLRTGAQGVYFSNNKDVSSDLEFAEYDPVTKRLIIKNWKINDEASSVRGANVNQITAMGIQAQGIGMGYQLALTGVGNAAGSILGGMTGLRAAGGLSNQGSAITGPGGIGASTSAMSDAQVAALLEVIRSENAAARAREEAARVQRLADLEAAKAATQPAQ